LIYSGVAGVLSFSDKIDITKITSYMIDKLRHRGHAFPIYIGNKNDSYTYGALIQFSLDFQQDVFEKINLCGNKYAILDGKIFGHLSPASGPLCCLPIEQCMGYYVLVIYDDKTRRLEIYRDFLGRKPLYFGYCDDYIIFASERKAFRNFVEPKRLEQGCKLIFERDGLSIERFSTLEMPKENQKFKDFEHCVNRLKELLYNSVSQLCTNEIAIMFSGGLDSSALAFIANKICDVELFSIGLPESKDIKWVRRAGELLGLNVEVKTVRQSELDYYLIRTIEAIEDVDPLKILIGVPIFIVSEFIHDNGYSIAMAGQGADELFGGYAKYLKMPPDELERALFDDVYNISIVNLERDDHISMANSIDLRLPYLHDDVIKFALRLPTRFKIYNGIRKYILRKTAEKMGVPKEIVYAEKKAIQYSTGISKYFEKKAKKLGMDLREYFRFIYKKSE